MRSLGALTSCPRPCPRPFSRAQCSCTHRQRRWRQLGTMSKVTYRTPDSLWPRAHLTTDFMVMATPARAILPLSFWPLLSGSKEDVLHLVQYMSTTEVILACTQPFSEHDGIHRGRSITDSPSHFIYYPKHVFPSGTGVILASYTLDDNTRFSARDHMWVVDIVLDDLASIHNFPKEELWALCPYSFVKNWGHEPHSMGGFTFFTPYQLVDYAKDLSQPEGQVYFKGEHMALPNSWIDMAIKSGLRAAKSIQAAVGLVEGQEPRDAREPHSKKEL